MPDTRRLLAPEDSYTPFSKAQPVVLLENGKRKDGRQQKQVRPLYINTGIVSQAKGSAYIEMDKTKVICAVYGPREVRKREELSMTGQLECELKFAPFACERRRAHQQDNQEKEYSKILREALEPAVCLEKFPKAKMDVFVNVLQDDGSVLAAALSCASVALADASIHMFDLVVGCSIRQCPESCLLDPCKSEEYQPTIAENNGSHGNMTVGLMPSLNQVAALVHDGNMDCSITQQSIKLCLDACQKIYPVLQNCLQESVKKKLKL